MSEYLPHEIVVRTARPDDRSRLSRLAELDSAYRPLAEPVLVAEVDGEVRAAMAVAGGGAIADPFHNTSDAVALLELRAKTLRSTAAPRRRGLRRRRTTRTAPRAA